MIESMNRRDFGRLVTTLGALGVVEPQAVVRALGPSERRLSWMAYRTTDAEGFWKLTDIEGEIPVDLEGTLYRVAPGQKDNHGTALNHLFDGDAHVSGFSFRDGSVVLRSSFIATPERQRELEAGKMIYGEFGTLPPGRTASSPRLEFKNQPNVNIIHYDGRLLALSEGGHPTAVDPGTLAYQGRWDFHGTLPPFVPFTAHPKYDPATGEAFGYGVAQGPGMALTVFRMRPDGRLVKLHTVPQRGYYMIHDMLLSKNHLVFVIPPVQIDLATVMAGNTSVAQALRYLEQEPTRLMILRRDGTGEPLVIEQPPSMVFHNGNAYEENGDLVVDTFLSPDGGVLELLHAFAKDRVLEVAPPQLTRLRIDLEGRKVRSREVLASEEEFPRFDIRRTGTAARYLYTMASDAVVDPYVAHTLVRRDLIDGTTRRVEAEAGRALGETVFVARPGGEDEDDGWLLLQGYDAGRDENFLEIRDAGTLDLAARAWTGIHFPLGFHGNFAPGVMVES